MSAPDAASAALPEPAVAPRELVERIVGNVGKVVRGLRDPLELLVCCAAAGGHALLEDIPGTGKTTLAKTLAATVGGTFRRVQFTPDLLPTDILGTSVFNPRDGTFRFQPGPVFTHVLIADEINRASPRTQSALLEALGEGQVSLDGITHRLEPPFLCIATQNPVEYHGTYPLPEAQLDRFTVRLSLGYPRGEEEHAILEAQSGRHPLDSLGAVCAPADLVALQRAVEGVAMERTVADYLLRLVHATRAHASVRLGVSMRGALHFARMGRARALSHGRDYVLPEDLKVLAAPVLAHRLVLDPRARYAGTDRHALVCEIADQVPVPR